MAINEYGQIVDDGSSTVEEHISDYADYDWRDDDEF